MSFRRGSLNGIPRMTVTPQSRLGTWEDTILDTSTSHMSLSMRSYSCFHYTKFEEAKLVFLKTHKENACLEKTSRGASWDTCVLPFTEELHRTRSPARTLHRFYHWRQCVLKTVTSSILVGDRQDFSCWQGWDITQRFLQIPTGHRR